MSRKTLAVFFVLALFMLFPTVILHPANFVSASSTEGWVRTYGGANLESAESLIQTSDGGYAIGGKTGSGALLLKTDSYGNMEWNQTYGGGGALSLVETSDGGYALAGGTRLIKTDAYGNMEWYRTYGEGEVRSLVETSDGGYALAGSTTMNVWGYYSDFWLVKTDAHGNMEWNRTYGRMNEEWIRLSGDVYDRARSVVEMSDGGYALAGNTGPGVLSGEDAWLVKTDEHGNMEWNQTYENGLVYSLVVTSDEGFAMAGHTRSYGAIYDDFWLVKTDGYGKVEWNQTYGGTGFETAHSLLETSDGGYILAGDTNSFGAGYNDFWLAKTDEYGIPEFPSWAILPLLLVAALVAVIYKKRLFSAD